MSLARLGSLNALEQEKQNKFWKKWTGNKTFPSADTNGRVYSLIVLDTIREAIKRLYDKLKRNKRLKSPPHGKIVLVIDGHESSSSFLRCCPSCLKRKLNNNRIQYYHREVVAMLVFDDFNMPIDCEQQLPGEQEVTTSYRLLERVLRMYPRAFDLIAVDGLYVSAPFFKLAIKHKKDVIAVLKDERRELYKDVEGLRRLEQPIEEEILNRKCQIWDFENLTTWTQIGRDVRCVCSVEEKTVRRQKSKEKEKIISKWIWVTTLAKKDVSTIDIVKLGHSRWHIENQGFNELVNEWNANHVYKHSGNAIIGFWLTTMFAYIIFHAFFRFNLKPEVRKKYTKRFILNKIFADLSSNNLPP